MHVRISDMYFLLVLFMNFFIYEHSILIFLISYFLKGLHVLLLFLGGQVRAALLHQGKRLILAEYFLELLKVRSLFLSFTGCLCGLLVSKFVLLSYLE